LVALANLALIEGEQTAVSEGVQQAEQATEAARAVWDEIHLAEALDVNARLLLSLGQPERAVKDSTALMQLLESYSWLPRPQNYLYTHAVALRALGRKAEANDHLEHAHIRVMFIADKLTDESMRKSWLRNVRVNSEILRCWKETRLDR
jgi:tetratricopeptide (TPR) repeat protein